MYTRKDYMDDKCSHREYYAQFVTKSLRVSVEMIIGIERIKNSNDPHFNDIPLVLWDRISNIHQEEIAQINLRINGSCSASLSDGVCAAKECATQMKEESK